MDAFDDLVQRKLPVRETILSRIDEYTLYCYYTEIDDLIPGKPITSPIRTKDDNPSFVVFPTNGGKDGRYSEFEFTWSDRSLGISGNIFGLIKKMYGLSSYNEVYALINKDFDLDLVCQDINAEKISLYSKPDPVEIAIKIHSIPYTLRGREFWKVWRIEKDLLDFYYTRQIDYYWSVENQEVPKGCLDPTFAYEIGGFYQIYSPYAPRKDKFKNNLPSDYFFGYLQLPPQGDLLIIDKSSKDVIFCRRLGYWAVAGKSETTMIPPSKMLELKTRFKRIVIMLDNDEAGRNQTEKYLALYPWLEPLFLIDAKDKTDLALKVGFDEASNTIKQLIK